MPKRELAASDPDPDRPAEHDATGAAPQPEPAPSPMPPSMGSLGLGVRYVSHPASLPSVPDPPPPAPALALSPPWSPGERFAPPGPAQVGMPVLDMTLPADPKPPEMLAGGESAAPGQLPLAASLPVLDAIAPHAPPQPHPRTMFAAADDAGPSTSEPATIEEPAGAQAAPVPAPPASDAVEPAVAWPEPGAAPQPARVRRGRGSDEKLSSLWVTGPIDHYAPPAPAKARPPRRRRLVVALCVVAGVSLGGGVGAMLLGRRDSVAALPSVPGTYNAPMMVLRASLAGQVIDVSVQPGQTVGPDTPLLSIRTANADADFAVLAHVNGIVRSVETQTGVGVKPGMPLLRILDCDHAFLTFGPGVTLRAGQPVQVRLPNLPPTAATVRASAGWTEPPDSLVVPLPAAALGGACPVGGVASVSVAGGS